MAWSGAEREEEMDGEAVAGGGCEEWNEEGERRSRLGGGVGSGGDEGERELQVPLGEERERRKRRRRRKRRQGQGQRKRAKALSGCKPVYIRATYYCIYFYCIVDIFRPT